MESDNEWRIVHAASSSRGMRLGKAAFASFSRKFQWMPTPS